MLCVCIFCLLPVRASAAARIDVGQPTSLGLTYRYGTTTLPGVSVYVYRVAEVSDTGLFTLTGELAGEKVAVNHLTSSQWEAAAQTLSGYVAADKMPAADTGKSDANGQISFSSLKTGLYLVVASRLRYGSYTYTFAPFLISLPNLENGNNWVYNVTANPKIDRDRNSGGGGGGSGGGGGGGAPGKISYQIVKHWSDSGYENERPRSVSVEILKNGESYAVRSLSESNNWTYFWTADDDGSDWQVVEREVGDAYTVTVTGNSTAFALTNTRNIEIIDDEVPLGPAPSGTEEILDDSTPASGGKLPQTGQLWWPVPLLSVSGLLLFGLGWVLDKRGKRHEQ